MKIGELFSGYGGLGMGVQSVLGGDVVWHSEIDKGACKILAHRYPDVPNLGDITTVDWSQVEPVDVLTGGFPCQDVSAAGRRAGIRPGTRSGLWSQFAYAISQLRPRTVVIENVRGLLSAEAHSNVEPCPWCVGDDTDGALRALGAVLGDLASIRYDAQWHGLRAADVGAPHSRFRVFIVAHPVGERHERGGRARDGWAGPADDDRGSVGLLPTPTARDWKNVGDPDKTAGRMAERGQPLGEVVVNALLPTPAVNDMGEGKTPDAWDEWTAKMQAAHGNGNGHGKSLSIEAQRLLPTPEAARAGGTPERHLERKFEADGSRRTSVTNLDVLAAGASTEWGDYAAAIARWETVLGRPAPAPTMTSAKGNPQLSPKFVEWMMGLPAGWVTEVPGITRNEALRALGNGVVPQQCAAALRLMLGQAVAAPAAGADRLLPTPMTAYSQRDPEKWLDERPAGNGQRREVISDLEIVAKLMDPSTEATP